MGNCWNSCFEAPKNRSNSYLREDYEGESLNIEFENLVEEDNIDSEGNFISESERAHLMSRNYDKIAEDQRKLDEQIDEELNRQENNLKVEEEAYIAAKKEAARVARQKKLEENKAKANGTGPKRWLGENESDWDVAGGEDDFEMFLESVKARSLNAPANGMENPNILREGEITEAEVQAIARGHGHINAGMDMDWEEDFVGAEISESDYTATNGEVDPATIDTADLTDQVNAGKRITGNVNEFVTEAQIETIHNDLEFEDEFTTAVVPKAASRENLVESEAER